MAAFSLKTLWKCCFDNKFLFPLIPNGRVLWNSHSSVRFHIQQKPRGYAKNYVLKVFNPLVWWAWMGCILLLFREQKTTCAYPLLSMKHLMIPENYVARLSTQADTGVGQVLSCSLQIFYTIAVPYSHQTALFDLDPRKLKNGLLQYDPAHPLGSSQCSSSIWSMIIGSSTKGLLGHGIQTWSTLTLD